MYPVSQSQESFESGGRPIRLDCFLPQGDGQRFPAVIGLHGSGGSHAAMSVPATMLAERGFAVYVLRYFDSTGTEHADKATIFKNFPMWGKTLWDAVGYVSGQPGVDSARIGLLGFSLGAYLALSVAAVDSRVQAVVDFFGGLPKEMKFFMRRLCPVLILHGEKDEVVPVSEAYHLQKLLEQRHIAYEMQIYPEAGHGFSGETWKDAGERSLRFLQKHLADGTG